MKFYQDNERNQSQPFSNDTFKLSLKEIILRCVPDIDKFLTKFLKSKKIEKYAEIIPIYTEYPFDYTPIEEREIVDYLIDVTIASHILYTLFFTTTDEELKNKIDMRIGELNDALGPRTGETVIESYSE